MFKHVKRIYRWPDSFTICWSNKCFIILTTAFGPKCSWTGLQHTEIAPPLAKFPRQKTLKPCSIFRQMIKSLELGQLWSLAGYLLLLYSLPKLQLIASLEHAYGIFQQILWLILFIRAQKMSIFLLDQNEF